MDAVLVYDGGCGVCGFAKSVVQVLDRRRRIRAVRLQDPESARLLAEFDEGARWDSFHFISASCRRAGKTSVSSFNSKPWWILWGEAAGPWGRVASQAAWILRISSGPRWESKVFSREGDRW